MKMRIFSYLLLVAVHPVEGMRLNAFSHQNLIPKIMLKLHKLLHRLHSMNRSYQASPIYDHIFFPLLTVRNYLYVFVHVDPLNYVTSPGLHTVKSGIGFS